MEEGTILKWLLSEGDTVTTNSLLFELETDKAIVEVPSPADGVLLKILSLTGLVPVETVVGWVGAPGESIDPEVPIPNVDHREPPSVTAPRTESRSSVPSTPAARRRASELNVDIASVSGTGPNDRITQEDVELAAVAKTETRRSNERSRGELARSLSHAWQTVPHIHISRRLNADILADRSESVRGQRISLTDLLLFVLSKALPEFPEVTCTWRDDRLETASAIHVAFAVDTGSNVVAPVIRDISALSLLQISQRRRELTDAARQQRLRLSDLQDGVFTLSNLGMSGVDFFAPIVAWPQTAILAVGRMTQEPVVRAGSVEIGWQMWANVALDHRAIDGAVGARFLAKLQNDLNQLSKDFLTR